MELLWIFLAGVSMLVCTVVFDLTLSVAFVISIVVATLGTIVLWFFGTLLFGNNEPEVTDTDRVRRQIDRDLNDILTQARRRIEEPPARPPVRRRKRIAATENDEAILFELVPVIEPKSGVPVKGHSIDIDVAAAIRPSAVIKVKSSLLVGQPMEICFEVLDPTGNSVYDVTLQQTFVKGDNYIVPDESRFPIEATTPQGTWQLVIWINGNIRWAAMPFKVYKVSLGDIRANIAPDMEITDEAVQAAELLNQRGGGASIDDLLGRKK